MSITDRILVLVGLAARKPKTSLPSHGSDYDSSAGRSAQLNPLSKFHSEWPPEDAEADRDANFSEN